MANFFMAINGERCPHNIMEVMTSTSDSRSSAEINQFNPCAKANGAILLYFRNNGQQLMEKRKLMWHVFWVGYAVN